MSNSGPSQEAISACRNPLDMRPRVLTLLVLLFFTASASAQVSMVDSLLKTIQSGDYEGAVQMIVATPSEAEKAYRDLEAYLPSAETTEEQQGVALLMNVIARTFEMRLGRAELSGELQRQGLLLPEMAWDGSVLAQAAPAPPPASPSAVSSSAVDQGDFAEVMAAAQAAMSRLTEVAPYSLLASRTGNPREAMAMVELAVPGLLETFTVDWSNEQVRKAEKSYELSKGTPAEQTAKGLLDSSRELQLSIVQSQVTSPLFGVGMLFATGYYTAAITVGEQLLADLQRDGVLEKLGEEEMLFRFFVLRSAVQGGRPDVFAKHYDRLLELARVHGGVGDPPTLETYQVQSRFAMSPSLELYLEARPRLWPTLISAPPESVDAAALFFWPLANRTLAAAYAPGSAERALLDQRFEQDVAEVRARGTKAWSSPLDGAHLGSWDPRPYLNLLDLYLDLAGLARRAGDLDEAKVYLDTVERALPELAVRAEQVNKVAGAGFAACGVDYDAGKGHLRRLPAHYHQELARWKIARAESTSALEDAESTSALKDVETASAIFLSCEQPGRASALKALATLLSVRSGAVPAEQAVDELSGWIGQNRAELSRPTLVESELALGELYHLRGNLAASARELERGLSGYEKLVEEVGPRALVVEELRQQALRCYDLLFSALQSQGLTERALGALDRKSQLQAIYALDITATRPEDPEIRRKLENLSQARQRMNGAERQMAQGQAAEKEMGGAKVAFADALKDLAASRYARYLAVKPPQLGHIQKVIPPDVALVQPAFRDGGLVLLVATQEELKAYEVAVDLTTVERLVRAFRSQVLANHPEGVNWAAPEQQKFLKASAELHKILVEPWEASLKGKKVLAFIPSGPLYYLPFQSLASRRADGQPQFLIERYQVVTLCKPSDLEHLRAGGSGRSEKLAAFGNPDGSLPGAESEVRDLAALYPESKTYLGAQASKARLRDVEKEAGLLHLATHGVLNLREPRYSYLVLAGEGTAGQLSFSDIAGLQLKGNRLVTLSACETALGAARPGQEDVAHEMAQEKESLVISSLAEAFTAAGSPTVLATLWKVDDKATRMLMSNFYSAMKKGMSPGAAMQQAQVALLKEGPYGHPFYWSPFVMWGDWR